MNLHRILEKYDPNNDVIAGGPNVTWAEAQLAMALLKAHKQIQHLAARIEALETTLNEKDGAA